MNVLALQHVAFESPGLIAQWASARGHALAILRCDQAIDLPDVDSFDMLVDGRA